MTRVLVTGAAGFIGSHLVEALAGRGDDVVGVDNFDPFYPRAMKERNLREIGERPGFCFHELDMLEVEALARLLRPDTVLIHLAGKAGVRPSIADPVGYARANVGGTAAVLEAARRAGVRRVVYGSSSSVYGDTTPTPFREDAVAVEPVSPYAATKRAGELLVHAQAHLQGLQVASLRFFTVFGPRQRPDLAIHSFARRMSEGRPLTLFGDGTQSRDYTYCDDIVAGVLAAIDWTANRAGRHGDLQSRRKPSRGPQAVGGHVIDGAQHPTGHRVGADAAGGCSTNLGRREQVGPSARLRAADATRGRDRSVRHLVSGGLCTGTLITCWPAPANGLRRAIRSARCT
jgi:UDP-glucuronate 4-epimerase